MKEKKITIKPFLNTQLGAIGTLMDERGTIKTYPLYYKVTFNRKSTQLHSLYALSGYEDIGSIDSTILDFESRVLNKVIAHETAEAQEDYQLAGLKKKFELYALSMDHVLDKHLRKQLQQAVSVIDSPHRFVLNFDNYNIQNSIFNIHEACKLLFPDLDTHLGESLLEKIRSFEAYRKIMGTPMFEYDFHTLIDWMDGTAKDLLQKGLQESYGAQKVSSILHTIDEIVQTRLKNMN